MTDHVVDWLLEGDPAVAWQAQRDLTNADPEVWSATRSRVANEGWGRRLLDAQAADGLWGGGLYQPKWTSTHYTLMLLRRLGLPPGNGQAVTGVMRLLDDADWVDGGVSYWSGRLLAERCVNGMVLSLAAYFGIGEPRVDSIAGLLIGSRLADGGWNCRDYEGATHSSFHTTVSVLEGLLLWQRLTGSTAADEAVATGQEFLLRHRMYKSHRTGAVINQAWLTFHFPPRWHYDVLRGLDYLRDAGTPPDERATDGIDLVRAKRRPDGKWDKGTQYGGETYFMLEPGRVPGRWNTLHSLRVLNWWEAGAPG
jgi:hypothetical protein